MIRFGIVGAGDIAHKFAKDIQHSPYAELVGVASRSMDRAKEFQKTYDINYAFDSYENLATSDVIDAVYIATPHNFHKDHTILFLENKKHVLCEKPMAVNQKQLELMIQTAKANNVLLMEAMWTSFLPITRKIIEIFESNKLGLLKEIELEFGFNLIEDYDPDRRLLNMDLAGGSVLDIGIYPIQYALHFMNPAQLKITAEAEFHDTGVDTSCQMVIVDPIRNITSKLKSSIKENLTENGKLIFENGIIEIENFHSGTTIYVNDTKIELPYRGEGFVDEIDGFCKTILSDELENGIMSYETSLNAIKVSDKVRSIIHLVYPFEKK
jgi:predicted dehydrogenase